MSRLMRKAEVGGSPLSEDDQGQGKEIREKVETSLDTEEEVPHLPDFQEPRRFTLLPKHHRDTHK